MGPEEAKAAGNDAFRRRHYLEAVQCYTSALELLPELAAAAAGEVRTATAAAQQQLHLALLTNRSLALHRMGRYRSSAVDAEAALSIDATSKKSAFRAAAARLMLGDAAAAARLAEQLQPALPQAAGSTSGALPIGSVALRTHAAALLAHQQQIAVLERQAAQGPEAAVHQQVATLLQALAAEAEGEGEDDADACQLLNRVCTVLGSSGAAAGAAAGAVSRLGGQPVAQGVAEAAAALEACGKQGHSLLLFFLADPDPGCQQAAAAALQAAAQAAAGGRVDIVLWPPAVWCRLVGLAVDSDTGSSGTAAMQLLQWAAVRDAWVRHHLLLHPLPVPGADAAARAGAAPAPADGSRAAPSLMAQVTALLADSSKLQHLAPATVEAAAQLLLLYSSDAAAAEGLRQLGCQPLLALLKAAAAAEGMAAFQADAQQPVGGAGSSAHHPAGGLSSDMPTTAAPTSGASSCGASSSSLQAVEQEALQQLRQKRQQVYDPRLVALRRCLLSAAAELAGSSRELVLEEAVVQRQAIQGGGGSCKASSGGGRKRSMAAGAFLTELLALTRELHQQQPRRTAAMLGPNGTPSTYLKRRFAADFRDNPAGDFLLSLDLQDGAAGRASSGAAAGVMPGCNAMIQAAHGDTWSASSTGRSRRDGQDAAAPTEPPPTLLDLALRLVLSTAAASATSAALLYRHGMFGLCQELCSYCTASVVAAGQQLYAAVADRVPAAAEELVQEAVVPGLAGLVLHSSSSQLQLQALDKLAGLADTCSGDEFAMLCGLGAGAAGPGAGAAAAAQQSAIFQAWQLASGDDLAAPAAGEAGSPGLQQAARRLLLRCCERAQRQQRLGEQAPPLGGAWSAIGRQGLLRLLRTQQGQQAGPSRAQLADASEGAGFPQLRRGFLSKPSPASRAAAAKASEELPGLGQQAATAPKAAPIQSSLRPRHDNASGTSSGAAGAPLSPQAAGTQDAQHSRGADHRWAAGGGAAAVGAGEAAADKEAAEDADVEELRDVFDSSASVAAEQRRARSEWLALPPEKRFTWSQTSTDVSVHIRVPAGTQASEVQVEATGDQLMAGLKWYGRMLHGRLHRRIKARELHWCLEDSEVHVLLAKADAGGWWKTLLEGGQERSHLEILKEAVDADEPVQSYDQLDDSAKELIDRIQERQQYIAAGLIDPEGFDDFRVVLGDSSLAPHS